MKHPNPWPEGASDTKEKGMVCVYVDHTGVKKFAAAATKKPKLTPEKEA